MDAINTTARAKNFLMANYPPSQKSSMVPSAGRPSGLCPDQEDHFRSDPRAPASHTGIESLRHLPRDHPSQRDPVEVGQSSKRCAIAFPAEGAAGNETQKIQRGRTPNPSGSPPRPATRHREVSRFAVKWADEPLAPPPAQIPPALPTPYFHQN